LTHSREGERTPRSFDFAQDDERRKPPQSPLSGGIIRVYRCFFLGLYARNRYFGEGGENIRPLRGMKAILRVPLRGMKFREEGHHIPQDDSPASSG